MYSSGVRVAELCLMKIEEVDFSNGFVRIPKENTKTKQSRTVRVGKEKRVIFLDQGKGNNSLLEGLNR